MRGAALRGSEEPSVARGGALALRCHWRDIPEAARHNWQQKSRRDENEFVSCQCSLDLQVKQVRRDGLSAVPAEWQCRCAARSRRVAAAACRAPAGRPHLGRARSSVSPCFTAATQRTRAQCDGRASEKRRPTPHPGRRAIVKALRLFVIHWAPALAPQRSPDGDTKI